MCTLRALRICDVNISTLKNTEFFIFFGDADLKSCLASLCFKGALMKDETIYDVPYHQNKPRNTMHLDKMLKDFEARISSLEKEMNRKNSEIEDMQEKLSEL